MRFINTSVLEEQINYANKLSTSSLLKKILFSFMGGFFVSFGYIGYLTIVSKVSDPGIGLFLGAALFPVGIIMCLFIGGFLFTSNALMSFGLYTKKLKLKVFLITMSITFIFNAIGCITAAGIAIGANIFGGINGLLNEIGNKTISVATSKFKSEWWSTFLSGILCNILVAGSVFAYNNCKSKSIGVFVVYIMIFLFAISGFQHVVANFFVISGGGFLSIMSKNAWTSFEVGQIFYNCIIPSTIGNLLGGLLVSLIYLFGESSDKNKKDKEDKLVNSNIEMNNK